MPSIGAPSADVAIVEFADYECPFCARHATTVFPQIREKYVVTGHLRYAYANNPLLIHPSARFLASAAICAGEQGLYWEMHDLHFDLLPSTLQELVPLLEDWSIDSAQLEACIESGSADAAIDRDIQIAQALQVQGTPGFALGRVNDEGHLEVERIITGAQPFATFEVEIDKILRD